MAQDNPDLTQFFYDSNVSDTVWGNSLTADGTLLVMPTHILVGAIGHLIYPPNGYSVPAGKRYIPLRVVIYAFLPHALVAEDLVSAPRLWVPHKAWLTAFLQAAYETGSFPTTTFSSESDLLRAISTCAPLMPNDALTISKSDVHIFGAAQGPTTWIDCLTPFDLHQRDRTAVVYSQFLVIFPGCWAPSSRRSSAPAGLINQAPYTVATRCGDIQGQPPEAQGAHIAQFFRNDVLPLINTYYPITTNSCSVELSRRANTDEAARFLPLFLMSWTQYTGFRQLLQVSDEALTGDAALSHVKTLAVKVNISGPFVPAVATALNHSIVSALPSLDNDEMRKATVEQRIAAAGSIILASSTTSTTTSGNSADGAHSSCTL